MPHPTDLDSSESANDCNTAPIQAPGTIPAPIQAPGTIQPHGVLLVFASDSHTCCQYSRNLEALAQRSSDQILHAPAADLLGAELAGLLTARLGRSPLGQRTVLGTKPLWQQRPFLVFAYRYERVYLVECCAVADPDHPESRADSQSVLRLAQHVQDIIRDLQATDSVAACCQRAAEWFRQVLGYDRVMVYCFDHDWHMQIVGEARRDDLESRLGLWFPASDLPEQSRELCVRNRVHVVGDTLAPQIPIVPELNPVTGQPLNLSDCVLRSISSVQREYLAKLGVRGVLAISIVYQQRLWGLILCRQMTPRWIDPSICGLCEVIASQLAQQLAHFEQAQVRDAEGRLQQMMPVVTDLLLHDVEWSTALADPRAGLLELIDADGLAVARHHELRTLGRTPSLPDLWCLLDWIEQYTAQPIYATNDLPAVCSTLAHLGETASGVLAIRCPGQERAYLLWLRGTRTTERIWMSGPNPPTTPDPTSPRPIADQPLTRWVQTITRRAQPWSRGELAIARMLRTSLLEVAGKIAEARESAQANALRLAQLALECCPEPIFICDLRGVPLLMNPAYVELFGEDALQVQNMNDLVGLSSNPDMVRSIAAAFRDGADSWQGEAMLRSATGEVIPVAVSVTRVYDKNNVPVGFIGLHRDLREQRRAAQERLELELHKQELARLESLAVLAGGVGHDFNNLLTTIFYYGHLLDNYLSEEPAKQALQRIMQASRHAADLCRQLMAYAGRAPTHMQAVDMPAVIRDTVALVQGNLHAEHRIELDIADELPPIIGDIVQLRQAVSNLLINASEAIGPKPGTITVGLCLAHSQSQDAPWCHRFVGTAHYQLGSLPPLRPCLMLCVHDTGCGMSQATMDRIFEPFYSTKAGGRGLGLANVVGAIRSHHGKLEIASTLGQGTLMRLWFPITQPTDSAPTHAYASSATVQSPASQPHAIAPGHSQATPSPPPRGLVLIADDEESIRELLANYLTVRGFQVQTTQTGPELLQLYRDRTEPVRLVIVDQQLPEMNGTTVAGQLAALDPTVPVLLISGYDLDPEQLRREIGSAQTLDFLRKPFTMRELDEQLKRMLTEKR